MSSTTLHTRKEKKTRNETMFLVKWQDWDVEESTWEESIWKAENCWERGLVVSSSPTYSEYFKLWVGAASKHSTAISGSIDFDDPLKFFLQS